jgi:hypothetical protein
MRRLTLSELLPPQIVFLTALLEPIPQTLQRLQLLLVQWLNRRL